MDDETASKFVSSLVKSIQSLCNGYIDFASSIEVIGHIHLNIDSGLKFNYILSEEVNKSQNEAATVFASHSYHSQRPASVNSKKPAHAQTDKAEAQRKFQVSRKDDSEPLIVPPLQPGFSPASRDSFTSVRSDDDVLQSSASRSRRESDSSHSQSASFGSPATHTSQSLDRRRKLRSEVHSSTATEPSSKRSRAGGAGSVVFTKSEFEVIEVKEEPDDDDAGRFFEQNDSDLSAAQDISQPDFSNLVADSLDRVGQLEGTSLLTGSDAQQLRGQQPYPLMLHANQAAAAGQASTSVPLPGPSDPQGGQTSGGHQLQSHVRNPHQHFMPFCPPPPRQQGFTVFDLTLTKVRTRLNYKPQDMSAAIADVQRGKLVRMAAVEHGVPLSSLYLRLKQQSSGGQQQSCEVPQQFVVRQQQSIGGKYDLVREQLPAGRQQQSDGGQQQLAERQQQSSGQQQSLEKQQVENRDDHQSQSSSVLRLPSERQHTAGLADSQQIATRHIPNAQLDSQASIAADHIHSGNSPNYFSSESR